MSARNSWACLLVDFHFFRAGDHRFRSIGANQLWPILRKQVTAGEDVSPDDASIDGDDDAHRIAIAQLVNQALIILLDRLGDGVDLFADFLSFR